MGNPVNIATNTVNPGAPYDVPFGADPSFYVPGGSGQIPIFRAAPGTLVPKVNSLGTPRAPGFGTGMPARSKESGTPSELTKIVLTAPGNNPDVRSPHTKIDPNMDYILGVQGTRPLASVPPPDDMGILLDVKA